MGLEYKKKWYMSKTVIVAVVALVIAIVTAATGETSVWTQSAIAVASGLGIYGRVSAKTELN